MSKLVARRSFLATFALIFLSIGVLFAIDSFLAKTEQQESTVEGARLFEEARELMRRGKNIEAAERLQDAISVARGNRDYSRTLAEAQLAAGNTAGAESTLLELLQSDSTDAVANLIMARVLVKENRFGEAISYFHRAVYGQWKENEVEQRRHVRLELIEVLAGHGSKEELLAELLPLQDSAPVDLPARIRLGRLFLLAGSPTRAADVFRAIVHDAPQNAEAYCGLGEAEFARANYRAAQLDFQVALRLDPAYQEAQQRLNTSNELLALDPTIRGLTPNERFERSEKLLRLTLEHARACSDPTPSPEISKLLEQADEALASKADARRRSEAFESNLDLAEKIWKAGKECKPLLNAESPLALVLARLSR